MTRVQIGQRVRVPSGGHHRVVMLGRKRIEVHGQMTSYSIAWTVPEARWKRGLFMPKRAWFAVARLRAAR